MDVSIAATASRAIVQAADTRKFIVGATVDWRFEVFKQAILSRVPFATTIRNIKRRAFGYEPDVENLHGTIAHYKKMKSALEAAGCTFRDATVLEIGSGWFPIIPIMLALEGAQRIIMSDLHRHMDALTFSAALHFLRENMPHISALKRISSIEDLPIDYVAPFNISHISDSSIDYVVSRTVLEHIEPAALVSLLKDLRAKLAPGGLMVHLVDHSDHLEHSDKSLTKINFLTWSEGKHAFITLLMQGGENRLRYHEYEKIFESSGYKIVNMINEIHEPTQKIVHSLRLAPRYKQMSPEQLATLSSLYILKPVETKFS